MSTTIPARMLATGDQVFFPRIGKRTVKKLAAADTRHVSLIFDDGKKRTLSVGMEFESVLNEVLPVAGENEIYRQDLASGRVSIISAYAFHGGFKDISENFQEISRGFVRSGNTNVAISDLRLGAVLHTDVAVYWVPAEQITQRANS